ncbi:type II toxin-antitoxin system HigB family toxin [Fulvivirga ligni]|uniref:type II toxin-antitoxin system HigB family toxin n=1 Tax=Fulvivirga ligni TaxID=2904246 RepID=UPI001F3B2F85|nr:type II toxin-antitoxin system HigB family toxin [Fulvivirga ligni]UII21578.1 type II toxin-antitoxin system HigB family toxin [Fulvivirga ligni]UII21632.1 type II toxin-antitoxin system HigB family toxin [Fulvivirga ligni]
MRIISVGTLHNFHKKNPTSKTGLVLWIKSMKSAQIEKPNDITELFNKSRIIDNNRAIFNIAKNKFRLVVAFNFSTSIVYIRFIGTHADYNNINPETI